MNTDPHQPETVRPARRGRFIRAVLGLAVLIFILHGRAVSYGLFMDDYAHYRQLRECGWSFEELTRACHLELIGGVIELWWMPDCTLRFFRPLAFGIMKLTYTIGDWSPVVMHVASLAWHLVNCALLMLLLRRLGTRGSIAWAIAALFAIHPGHVATVQWIASQTELIVTALLLGALLCWAEFRGWPSDAGPPPPTTRTRWGWGTACAVLFLIALGCRENAIMFPFVVLAVEPLMRRHRARSTLLLFAVLGVLAGAYLALRTHYLGGTALPPRPYVVPPTAADFPRFVLDKACYYLLGEFLLVPCVPIGGLAYFRERPLMFYGLALAIVVVLAALCVRNRRRVAGILGPACLLGLMAPVLPAFESPHHLYLPGIGWAIMAALAFREIGADDARLSAANRARRRALTWSGLAFTGLVFGVATHFFGLALDTAQAVEDRVVDEIATAPRPVRDGDTLYVANLPVIAHYTKLAVEERTGVRNLRVVALTWSPRLLGMATPSECTLIDPRTIEVRVIGDRYLSGPLQLLSRQAAGDEPPADALEIARHETFRVDVLERDHEGISALRFTFGEPLAQTGIHLFWGSQSRWAYQISP